jgi:uncharacterized phage protein (TIGR02220 family)
MKRFTATEKWSKPWFRKLAPKLKLFWDYLCDNCDAAGVWIVDLEAAEFYIGETYTEQEVLTVFGDRIHPFDDGKKWWLTGFIEFQYGELSEACKPHKAILGQLKRHGIHTLWEGYTKGIHTLQDKDKDKDKDRGGLGEAPTDEQWTECTSKARIVLGYLNAKTGSRFPESASCLDPISNRLFRVQLDVEGCKRMIDRFVSLWKNDPRMQQCLRPSTLFGDKFDDYYGQRDIAPPKVHANGKAERKFVSGTENL